MLGRSVLLGGLIVVVAAAWGFVNHVEPTDEQLRATFEEHRVLLDELRQLFDQDVTRDNVISVNASSVLLTQCKDGRRGTACLGFYRWLKYESRLKRCGVQAIETHETPGIYFRVYRSLIWNESFRFRGLVYAPGVPRVVHNHDDSEERIDLGRGWYAYLIIDT